MTTSVWEELPGTWEDGWRFSCSKMFCSLPKTWRVNLSLQLCPARGQTSSGCFLFFLTLIGEDCEPAHVIYEGSEVWGFNWRIHTCGISKLLYFGHLKDMIGFNKVGINCRAVSASVLSIKLRVCCIVCLCVRQVYMYHSCFFMELCVDSQSVTIVIIMYFNSQGIV